MTMGSHIAVGGQGGRWLGVGRHQGSRASLAAGVPYQSPGSREARGGEDRQGHLELA